VVFHHRDRCASGVVSRYPVRQDTIGTADEHVRTSGSG
jgi:hypothetical protein